VTTPSWHQTPWGAVDVNEPTASAQVSTWLNHDGARFVRELPELIDGYLCREVAPVINYLVEIGGDPQACLDAISNVLVEVAEGVRRNERLSSR
jgi:hypothetical protein